MTEKSVALATAHIECRPGGTSSNLGVGDFAYWYRCFCDRVTDDNEL